MARPKKEVAVNERSAVDTWEKLEKELQTEKELNNQLTIRLKQLERAVQLKHTDPWEPIEKPIITKLDFIKALRLRGNEPPDLGWYDYQDADFSFDGEYLEYKTRGGKVCRVSLAQIREYKL